MLALCRAMSLLEEVLALEWGSIMGMGLCEAVGQLRLWAAFSGADSQGGRAFLQLQTVLSDTEAGTSR